MTGDSKLVVSGAGSGSAADEKTPEPSPSAADTGLDQACANLHIAERVAYKALEGDQGVHLSPRREIPVQPVLPILAPWTRGARPRHIVAYAVPVRPKWPTSCRRVLRFN